MQWTSAAYVRIFRMPDVLSVGLGGGSLVRRCGDVTSYSYREPVS
jgi:hypothetical protein